MKTRILNQIIIDPETKCWNWAGYVSTTGYGQIKINNKTKNVHRVSWAVFKSPPKEKFVLHVCDNRRCVNPVHLFLGSQKTNIKDAVQKSRLANQNKTHCPKGHVYNEKNTRYGKTKQGGISRTCRVCALAKWHSSKKKKSF